MLELDHVGQGVKHLDGAGHVLALTVGVGLELLVGEGGVGIEHDVVGVADQLHDGGGVLAVLADHDHLAVREADLAQHLAAVHGGELQRDHVGVVAALGGHQVRAVLPALPLIVRLEGGAAVDHVFVHVVKAHVHEVGAQDALLVPLGPVLQGGLELLVGDAGLDDAVLIVLVPEVRALVGVAQIHVEHRAGHEQVLEVVGDGDAVAAVLVHHGLAEVLEVLDGLQLGGAFLFIPVLAHPHVERVVDDAVIVDRHAVQLAVHHAGLDGVGVGLLEIPDALGGVLGVHIGDVLDHAGLHQLAELDVVHAEGVRQVAGGDGVVQLAGIFAGIHDPVVGNLDAQLVVPRADPLVVGLVLAVLEHDVGALALRQADVDHRVIGRQPVALRRLDVVAGRVADLADGGGFELGQRADG